MRKPTIRQKLMSATPPAEGGAGTPVFQITSGNLDRHQDRVLAVKATGDEVRVPLLWEHNRWSPPVGFARCYREGDVWVMAPVFDEVDELSKTIAGKVQAGSLGACSIGFLPLQEPVPNAEGGFDYPLVELLEVSIVNVPANADAVRLRSLGKGARRPGLAQALKALASSHAALLDVLKSEGDAPEEEPEKDEGEEETPAEEKAGAEGGEASPEQSFAQGLLAHLQAGAQLASDFLSTGSEDELLTWIAEGAKTDLDQCISDLQAYLSGEEMDIPADGEEQAASEGDESDEDAPCEEEEEKDEGEDAEPDEDAELPDEGAASDEEAEDAPSEEAAKALRLRVCKHLGFTVAQAAALSGRELREYAALAA
ncbi:HK97 family phage prohead protease [Corallococcus exiguus]|uniref:HK97 family phage prohead protease n=1 Tax=Corallococcus exiguus TaxID=83462 RepID=UPI0020A63CED|nr:HK97 family phage prohead protease [Corallococcus exiguus]